MLEAFQGADPVECLHRMAPTSKGLTGPAKGGSQSDVVRGAALTCWRFFGIGFWFKCVEMHKMVDDRT